MLSTHTAGTPGVEPGRPKWIFTVLRPLGGLAVLLSLGLIIYPGVGFSYLFALLVGGSALWRALGRGGPRAYLLSLDRLVFSGEQLLVATSLAVMAGVVFLDVVWRTARSMEFDTAVGFAVGAFALVLVAAFTARAPGASIGFRLGAGLLAYGAILGGVWLVAQADNGFGWSQRLALVLVIWVGLIGGSMATRSGRHIAVDAVKRIVPERFARPLELVSGAVTVVVCGFLAAVGAMYCRNSVNDWLDADRQAFIFDSLPIPYWVASLAMPIGFGLMAARFLALTIAGAPASSGPDSHGVELREAKR